MARAMIRREGLNTNDLGKAIVRRCGCVRSRCRDIQYIYSALLGPISSAYVPNRTEAKTFRDNRGILTPLLSIRDDNRIGTDVSDHIQAGLKS